VTEGEKVGGEKHNSQFLILNSQSPKIKNAPEFCVLQGLTRVHLPLLSTTPIGLIRKDTEQILKKFFEMGLSTSNYLDFMKIQV
jgi:hypothetical protein